MRLNTRRRTCRCYGDESCHLVAVAGALSVNHCIAARLPRRYAPRNDNRRTLPPTAAVFHPAAAVSKWGLTTLATSATARSISSAVVNRPTENLSVPIAYSRGMPIASSTLDTSTRSL